MHGMAVQKGGLHSCILLKKKQNNNPQTKTTPKTKTQREKTKQKKQNWGRVKRKSLISSSSFPRRGEFLAKAEALDMYVQPDRALKKQCRTYHMAAELIVSLLQPGIKNYHKDNFLGLTNARNITTH